jgi:glycosyltransferase involved in cell wall biosynthesis
MPSSVVVIMPVRDGLKFLPGAVECVTSQSYSPLELIVVDDGSEDGSLEWAQGAGLRVLQTPRVGPAAARNAAISASVSDLVAFLDVDDFWPPGTLHRLAAALSANPGAELAQGLIQNFRVREDGSKRFFTRPYRFLNLGACLYRRALFDRVGLLDESLTLCEDLDFMMRCWESDVCKADIDAVTLYYRRHPDSMTAGLQGAGLGTVQAYKRRIDRIRRGLYNPKEPRLVPASEYMGIGPGRQDEELAVS